MMDAIREVLNPWLGEPRWKQTEGRVTFVYRFDSEDNPPIPLKLKVEINTREQFAVYGFKKMPFAVDSRWFEGNCRIQTYELDELVGTKLRALYQRKQGRDLFDLAAGLERGEVNPERVVEAFSAYMYHGGQRVTRAQFEENLSGKLEDPQFTGDISPLLAAGMEWEIHQAAQIVASRLITRLPGDPWKGER
jgi:hypothetical protein